jgi:hypothetical protein
LQACRQSRIHLHADAEARDRAKAAPIGVGFLAVPFDDVQPDPWRDATSSVSCVAVEASRTLGGFRRPSEVADRNPVDITSLIPEQHRFSD